MAMYEVHLSCFQYAFRNDAAAAADGDIDAGQEMSSWLRLLYCRLQLMGCQ